MILLLALADRFMPSIFHDFVANCTQPLCFAHFAAKSLHFVANESALVARPVPGYEFLHSLLNRQLLEPLFI